MGDIKPELLRPDYLFEVSWEVCNKMGGIYTVVATKALFLQSQLRRRHILIGPDVWMHTAANPDFIEDPTLYKAWRQKAASEGLRVRIGRWNIPGKPTAILVDFKQFISVQDDILARLWNRFGVDSLTGNWDYKESALFGYVAGKVIESFRNFNLEPNEKVVAQFHEWQCGAGLLYIKEKELPIATVFTTHATMMGRCICGHGMPLYDALKNYDANRLAQEFGVVAINSLETKSALNADVLTTVSDITARECEQFYGRPVDVVTPNGFEDSFTPSTTAEWEAKKGTARKKLMTVASAMSGKQLPKDAFLLGIGGRYEYHNKGIDVLIDALAELKNSGYDGPEVHAFIMIPGGHNGPDKNLLARLSNAGAGNYTTQCSHYLMNPEWDTISRRFAEVGLYNQPDDKVKIYFVPSYLNGNDGIFNMSYYDLLIGLDLTAFPSYYEPWGYTPLESLAFSVPTLTTSVAGFGQWVKDYYEAEHPGITVVERDDKNYDEVVSAVAARVREVAMLDAEGRSEYTRSAKDISTIALWKNQIKYYNEAYSKALEKVVYRLENLPALKERKTMYNPIQVDAPSWKSVMVTRHLPEALSGLETLCKNLWWCWNDSAKALFKSIDPQIWSSSGHNPMVILDTVSIKKFKELAKDKDFLARLDEVMKEFNAYMAEKANRTEPNVAYFCMEYGLDTSLKIYSGGLGILAGDYLKETSDMNVNLTAIGFLYRYGYFNQQITAFGDQVADYQPVDFLKTPAQPVMEENGEWATISVPFPGRTVTARIWKVAVGRTDLYLLDTDFEANLPEDRVITHQLYGGDWENRLKQEILLGIGGIRAVRKLGLTPKIYHCNEGHAAFTGLERLREYVEHDNLDFSEALEVVRASSLFTTHTPVPAGHDAFDEGMLRQYIGHYPERLKVDWETMMALGKDHPTDVNEKFSMSILAANCAQNVNGVSMLHGLVSQEIFAHMYPGYLPEENHVSYVTNGVHYPTWCAKEWKALHAKVFGPEFQTHHYDKKCFEGVYNISDEEVFNVRKVLKDDLILNIKKRIADTSLGNHYSPRQIVKIKEAFRSDVLTIGFARRFATYKRATLLFSDLDRLDAIVNNPQHPVQFVFAGKAHPADKAGQDLIKQIIEISKQERFLGKIVFVPGYDITLAKRLVQGVDVWLNNPTRPQEASGTSGEKASMNGVMHFSVLDGWWVEGYKEGAGWALPLERTYDDQHYQNELDAATIYAIIENEIAPAFYAIDPATGRSSKWIGYIKNTIAQVACNFTTNRMLTDYCDQYYVPQNERTAAMEANDFALAREISAWKKRVRRQWQNVEVVSYTQPDSSYSLSEENKLKSEVVLNIGELQPQDLGVEMLFTAADNKGQFHIKEKVEFTLADYSDGVARFTADVLPERTGMYQVATRVYPKNENLPHRQDFALVKWL
ncbi:MAG: alpha-glucan family phosphorylase [Bacteroidales bacterium]|nr:alpha-glucan family phosphorylase [Bacteroidales bacterium]